jgi:hypothetical protein
MKTFKLLSLVATSFIALGASHTALAQQSVPQTAPIPVVRGALPADLAQDLRLPAKVAICKPGFTGSLNNGRFSCERAVRQSDDVKCPSNLPNFTARVASSASGDRDLCARTGVNITSDGSLQNFNEGRDFVFVPRNGVRNGVSFLARHPNATAADGWTLDTSNTGSNGITDRYKRTVIVKVSPELVIGQ